MSMIKIRALLQSHYTSVSSGVVHAFPNMKLNPVTGQAYERVDFLHVPPENPTFGEGLVRELGIMQVSLHHPQHAGAGAALERAETLKAAFKRGTTFNSASPNVRVLIERSPWVTELPQYESWFRLALSVAWVADVYGAGV